MKHVEALGEAIVRLSHNLAALLLAVATGLVFFQVITRFILGDAAGWSEISARAFIIWSTFLVASAAFRFGSMIPIDFLRGLLPPAWQIWVIRLVTGLTLLLLGVLFWYGWSMAVRVQAQRVAMLGISMSWLYAAIPVGALMAVPGVLLRHLDQERETQ